MKRGVLIAIIIFVIFISDFLVLLAYQSTAFQEKWYQNEDQANTLNYLKGKEDLGVDYSEKEITHLNDVKRLMNQANYYFVALTIILVFLLFYIYQKNKKVFYKPFFYGGLVSLAFLLLILLWILVDFSGIFNIFHRIFFEAGTWTFAADDKLPLVFPLSFFFGIAREIFVRAFISSIVLIVVGFILKNKKSIRKKK